MPARIERGFDLLKEQLVKTMGLNSTEDIPVKINEVIQHLIEQNNHYGLIWEDKTSKEMFEKRILDGHIPYIKEVNGRSIKNINCLNNVLIEGDNYHALKVLLATHRNNVDLIYIDPPYNTGKGDFKYNDNYVDKEDEYRHSKWLSFMSKRLNIAKDLLKEDAFIAVSIDNNEFAQLKLLCDEIFGENNLIEVVPVINNLKGRNDVGGENGGFSTIHEYLIIYAKNANKAVINNFIKDDVKESSIIYDEIGPYEEGRGIKRTSIDAPREKRPNGYFPLYVKEDLSDFSTEPFIGAIEVYPLTEGKEMSWTWSKEKFENDKSEVILKRTKNGISVYKKQRLDITSSVVSKNIKPKSVFYDPKYSSGASDFKNLGFDGGDFAFPKPVALLKDVLHIALANKENAIVLDFFAGSGTTAQAIVETNKDKGKNYQFILCTNNEVSEESTRKYVFDILEKEKNISEEKALKLFMSKYKGLLKEGQNQKESKSIKKISYSCMREILKNEKIDFLEDEYNEYGICRGITYKRIKKSLEKNNSSCGLSYYEVDFLNYTHNYASENELLNDTVFQESYAKVIEDIIKIKECDKIFETKHQNNYIKILESNEKNLIIIKESFYKHLEDIQKLLSEVCNDKENIVYFFCPSNINYSDNFANKQAFMQTIKEYINVSNQNLHDIPREYLEYIINGDFHI